MKNLRQKLLVDKNLQYNIIRYLVIYSTVLSMVFLSALYIAASLFITKIAQLNVDQEIINFLYSDINYLAISFFFLILLLAMASSYFSLVFSNKIAGPIYNMNQTLEANRKNNTKNFIKLRNQDYFLDLADKINHLIDQQKKD